MSTQRRLQSPLALLVAETTVRVNLGEQPPAQSCLTLSRELNGAVQRVPTKRTNGAELSGSI